MNDLCVDIGYKSINHFGEQLCGDHVDVVEQGENSTVIVLADGLGSGVKASILSTLTSKIISTMMAEGLSLEDCVETIAATLPICSVRGVAYSTFTIIHIVDNVDAELIQFDNPLVVLIRDFKNYDYPKTEMNIGGKKIYKSVIKLQEDDLFVAMSDGCPHAGLGIKYNFGWKREEIIDLIETIAPVGYTAKTCSTILIDKCNELYGGKPGDDATACVIKVRKREPMNILFGPPSNRDDANRMMSLFFSKEGKHIVCGGTTSSIAAKYLGKPLRASLNFEQSDIPPDRRNRRSRSRYRRRYNDQPRTRIRQGFTRREQTLREVGVRPRRRVANIAAFVRGGYRHQFLRRKSGKPRASESRPSHQLQHQNESCRGTFQVFKTNGKTHKSKLFLTYKFGCASQKRIYVYKKS